MRCIIRNIHDRDGITDEILSQLEKKFALERAIVLDVEKSEKREKEKRKAGRKTQAEKTVRPAVDRL